MFKMTNAGLDVEVCLKDGFTQGQDKFGPFYSIEDVPGVYKAISLWLVQGRGSLSNKELRLIRRQLELTQDQLGKEIGRTKQMVLLWEKRGNIPSDTASLIKMLLVRKLKPDLSIDGDIQTIASSVKSVGKLRLGKFPKCMIQSDFRDAVRSKAVGFSEGDFGFVVETLDDAAGELFFGAEIVEDEFAVGA